MTSNRILATGDSLSRPWSSDVGAAGVPAPHTDGLFHSLAYRHRGTIFDQIKFDAKAELLEQAARALPEPRVMVPTERPSNLPSGAKMERL